MGATARNRLSPVMPEFTRRRLLFAGVISAIAAGTGALWFRRKPKLPADAPLGDTEQAVLSDFIDLLIPRDETPGALDLGIHTILLQRAARSARFRADARAVCDTLNARAHAQNAASFLSLPMTDRIGLLTAMEQAPTDSLDKKFFDAMRHFSFHWYYADPRSWRSLCFSGPPQPDGYMDYRDAPAPCRKV